MELRMNICTKILLTGILAVPLLGHCGEKPFDGFYVGPSFSAATTYHAIGNTTVAKKKANEHKTLDATLGYGITLDKFPVYLGVEAYIPLQNENIKTDIHELTRNFPAEGAFKVGFLVDEKVMLYGKLGVVHQKLSYENKTANHKDSWDSTAPVYGAGLSFKLNEKWFINGEFVLHSSGGHKNTLISHEHNHQRIQITAAYRFKEIINV